MRKYSYKTLMLALLVEHIGRSLIGLTFGFLFIGHEAANMLLKFAFYIILDAFLLIVELGRAVLSVPLHFFFFASFAKIIVVDDTSDERFYIAGDFVKRGITSIWTVRHIERVWGDCCF